MASREINYLIDQEAGLLVASFASTQRAQPVRYVFGDTLPINVRVLVASGSASRVWDDADLTNKTVRVGIGTPNGQPSSGSMVVTYDGDSTAALDYNVSAADMQTALNALTSITAAGGVTVTKTTSGPYRIAFASVGARSAFSVDTTLLYPSSEATALIAMSGDGSTREVVILKLESQPVAYVELSDPLPSASATVSTVRAGVLDTTAEIQQFQFDPVPFDGVYSITIGADTTTSIDWDATASTIQSAIEALAGVGAGMATVTGEFPLFTVTFSATLGDVGEMAIDASGLTVPTGRTGTLNLNTAGMVDLLNGSARAEATLEFEVFDSVSSTAYTAAQLPIVVYEDVIGNTPASQTPLPTYITTSTSAESLATMLGLTTYADLTAANAALAPGIPYYDTALTRINITTA